MGFNKRSMAVLLFLAGCTLQAATQAVTFEKCQTSVVAPFAFLGYEAVGVNQIQSGQTFQVTVNATTTSATPVIVISNLTITTKFNN